MTQDTCWKIKQILQFSAVVLCDNQYDEFSFFNCTKNSKHLKIMSRASEARLAVHVSLRTSPGEG